MNLLLISDEMSCYHKVKATMKSIYIVDVYLHIVAIVNNTIELIKWICLSYEGKYFGVAQ